MTSAGFLRAGALCFGRRTKAAKHCSPALAAAVGDEM